MKTQHTHSVHQEVIVGFVLLLLTLITGGAWWAWRTTTPTSVSQQPIPSQVKNTPPATTKPKPVPYSIQKSPISTTKPTVPAVPVETLTPKINQQATQLQPQAYWLQVEGEEIRLIPQEITVKPGDSSEVALKAALNNLLSGSENSQLTTTIPTGTRLLGLRITKTGIYVNLSREFSQGGGSSSMIYRVAQVLYTVTSIEPQAKVYLSVEGQLLDEENPLGGEGLILTEPITRQQFVKDFSIEV